MRWATRQIEAPATDTVSASEVAVYLGFRDRKSVLRLVEAGEFPEPISEGGRRVWLWEDVVWFLMNKRVRHRIRAAGPAPADPAAGGRGQIRDKSGKRGHSRDSAGSTAATD